MTPQEIAIIALMALAITAFGVWSLKYQWGQLQETRGVDGEDLQEVRREWSAAHRQSYESMKAQVQSSKEMQTNVRTQLQALKELAHQLQQKKQE